MSCCGRAICPAGEIVLVEVHLQYLFLGVGPLQLDGGQSLFDLTLKRLLPRQEQHPGQLLGNR